MRRVWRLFRFAGRAGRREYWLTGVPVTAAIWGGLFAFMQLDAAIWAQGFLMFVGIPAAAVANLALGARRLHDIGKSAWWLALYFGVPFAMFFVITETRKGGLQDAAVAVLLVGPLIVLAELGFRRGQPGPNRFDVDSRGRMNLEVFD